MYEEGIVLWLKKRAYNVKNSLISITQRMLTGNNQRKLLQSVVLKQGQLREVKEKIQFRNA